MCYNSVGEGVGDGVGKGVGEGIGEGVGDGVGKVSVKVLAMVSAKASAIGKLPLSASVLVREMVSELILASHVLKLDVTNTHAQQCYNAYVVYIISAFYSHIMTSSVYLFTALFS